MTDTLAMFFDSQGKSVHSIDRANYFILITPPDAGDDRNNVEGFYKDGKIKFIGKDIPNSNSLKTGRVLLDGDCISYYPNGKRSSIVHYKTGYKDGLEYFYYSDGTEYSCIKHQLQKSITIDDPLDWECFDKNGNKICVDGNGHWITYNDENRTIELEGEVVNGHREGVWRGGIIKPDTVTYIYKYKKGQILSSIGYDKKGMAYPFEEEQTLANYRGGKNFLDAFIDRIKIPKDENDHKMSIDTIHVSFIVEKNGSVDQFQIIGNVNSQLKDAIFVALAKYYTWNPTRLYGVPFRTKITVLLKRANKEYGHFTTTEFPYDAEIINGGKFTINALNIVIGQFPPITQPPH